MRITKSFLLGILAALFLGGLASAGLATARGVLDTTPITVPVGNVGDQVTYAEFVREAHYTTIECRAEGYVSTMTSTGPSDDEPVPAGCKQTQCDIGPANGTIEAHGDCSERPDQAASYQVVKIDRLAESLDHEGRHREALVARTNATIIFGDNRWAETREEFVDLASRTVFRTESRLRDMSVTQFSEYFDGRDKLWYQGKTFHLGQDVPLPRSLDDDDRTGYATAVREITTLAKSTFTMSRVIVDHEDVPMDAEDRMYLSALTYSSKVVDRRLIEGHDSYAIKIQFLLDGAKLMEFMPPEPGSQEAEEMRTSQMFIEYVTWVSEDVPYPVLFEATEGMNRLGKRHVDSSRVFALAELKPGSRAIPWKDAPLPPIPTPERTPGSQLTPADGQGSRLAFPLGQALQDARSPLAPAAFQVWKQQRPDHVLVAAELRRGETNSPNSAAGLWHLVYAVPTGAGFEITVERGSGGAAGAPVFSSARERTVPVFKLSDLPRNPVTIAYAESAWRQTAATEYASRAPTFVHWGFDMDLRPACWEQNLAAPKASPADFRRLTFGYTEEGACVDPSTSSHESAVVVDTATGYLVGLYGARNDFDFHPIFGRTDAVTSEYEVRSLARKEIYAGPQAPNIGDAVLVSTSTLAVFLAVYFLPALKFVGAKAWMGVAGYAKLRKDELLENRIRDQILQVVRNDPGINTTDLAKRVDAGWGTVVYHLSVLEKNNLVSSLVDGRFHRFFPVGVMDFSLRGQVAVMKNERTKQIFELIDVEPGIVQEVLARRVGISPPAAIFHLKRLEEVGMVGRVKKGRKVHYFTNEKRMLPTAEAPPLQGMEFQ